MARCDSQVLKMVLNRLEFMKCVECLEKTSLVDHASGCVEDENPAIWVASSGMYMAFPNGQIGLSDLCKESLQSMSPWDIENLYKDVSAVLHRRVRNVGFMQWIVSVTQFIDLMRAGDIPWPGGAVPHHWLFLL